MSARSFILVSGADALHFLHGLVTQDVNKLAEQRIQFAALLSAQGKILHDFFLLSVTDAAGQPAVLIDTPAAYHATLLKRLAMYKLRSKVTLADASGQWHLAYDPAGLPDPRHPDLPHRLYSTTVAPSGALTEQDYRALCLALGIPDSAQDFAPDEVVALDAGYDLLHAVSFTKGCYVGQEITARMHYKNIARRGFYILSRNGIPERLALLKFEAMQASDGAIVLDGLSYTATLPGWILPKLQQSSATKE